MKQTPCGSLLWLLLSTVFSGSLPAAPQITWLNAFSGEGDRATLSVDGQAAFRQVPGGRICPWSVMPAGTRRYEVNDALGGVLAGEWPMAGDERCLFVTYGTTVRASRSIVLGEAKKDSCQILNTLDAVALRGRDVEGPVAHAGFALGVHLPDRAVFEFDDGARWEIFPGDGATGDAPGHWYWVLHRAAVVGPRDLTLNLFSLDGPQMKEWVLSASSGREPVTRQLGGFRADFFPSPKSPPAVFDPNQVDWTKVASRIAWFNATASSQTLSVGGLAVFRKQPAGRATPFAPWPEGTYECETRGNSSGVAGKGGFSLGPGKRAVLVSYAMPDQAPRFLAVEALAGKAKSPGDSRAESKKEEKVRVRIANAFPAGEFTLAVGASNLVVPSGTVSIPLDPQKELLADGRLSTGKISLPNGKRIGIMAKCPDLAIGSDWLLVFYMNAEKPEPLEYAWVEFSSGRILLPEDFGPPADPAE